MTPDTFHIDRLSRLKTLYEIQGSLDYGEDVSQRSHAIQCAELALAAQASSETVLAAFFHDIGHLLELEDGQDMEGFGHQAHDRVGADYLRTLGLPDRIPDLVSGHVAAKRYLTSMNPDYLTHLSEASRITLGFQGGPMTPEECTRFRQHPMSEDWLLLRQWDDEAKLNRDDEPVPDWIWKMVEHLLEK